jgi:hypothetical protein
MNKPSLKKIFNSHVVRLLIIYGIVLAVFLAACFGYGRLQRERADKSEMKLLESIDDLREPVVPHEDVSAGNENIYEAPSYDFKTDEITVEIEGVAGEYTIAFINDLHIITDKEAGDVLEENLQAVSERYETLSVTSEGVHAEELWQEIVKFLNYNDFDAVVFGGDILDYCSHSNMEALTEGFDSLKYPKDRILYIRSDHDYSGWYGGGVFTDTDGFIEQSMLWDSDDSRGFIEFDDFVIVGVNKSYQNLTDGKLDFLLGKLNGDKPVIVATHVPFYSETDSTLEEVSMETRNKIYYWNKENSIYEPDANTQKFIDTMYAPNSNVVEILAAHMHASWDGEVTNDLREHIFAPSYEGNIGIIHVVGKD